MNLHKYVVQQHKILTKRFYEFSILMTASVAMTISEEENEGLKGVRVNWKCQKCMKTRSRYPVWLTDRGQAATLDECGRLAAEEVLGRHAKCLGITDPRLKRNWLEQGKLDAEHEQAKKAKIEVQKQAEVQEKKSRTLEQFESNESKVSEGAAIETSSENMLTFDDPNLKDSPARTAA